jgi:hypothetical protein
MKKTLKLWIVVVVLIIIGSAGLLAFRDSKVGEKNNNSAIGNHMVGGSHQISSVANNHAPAETKGYYVIKYEWPEKPKVGNYTLKINLTDRTGTSVRNAEVKVSCDMPSMRGHHATTKIMKQNVKGDYLLPIHFAMRGKWEIVVSAEQDGNVIAIQTILLNI